MEPRPHLGQQCRFRDRNNNSQINSRAAWESPGITRDHQEAFLMHPGSIIDLSKIVIFVQKRIIHDLDGQGPHASRTVWLRVPRRTPEDNASHPSPPLRRSAPRNYGATHFPLGASECFSGGPPHNTLIGRIAIHGAAAVTMYSIAQ